MKQRIHRAPSVLGGLATAVALNFPSLALAGAVLDFDADLVPDQFDTCLDRANGPNQTSNQRDGDLDGYGNRCDPDFDQNCLVTAADFGTFLGCFGSICPFADFDGNATVTAADFGIFLGYFGRPPGPSGLACASCTRTGADPACRP